MKIVEINGTNYASTGNIVLNIAREARKEGMIVYTCCKNSRKGQEFNYQDQIYIGSRLERVISEEACRVSGFNDAFNCFGTRRFINELKRIKPDLIHLHVLHNSYLNLFLFSEYLRDIDIPVVWTMHDCWAITGKCPHFENYRCEKWKTGCHDCPQLREYPESLYFDRTGYYWNRKNEWFNGIKNLTIVTPSLWLADYVRKSFLKDHTILTINNGIDLNTFRPIDSEFRTENGLENKYLLLGVANTWSNRKGLDTFIELSKTLPEKYQILLVGTNAEIDKLLPESIISIHKTYNQEELVKIYSAADLFVNPTVQDNFPTVNIEALACGTPVITYRTGGSPETINDECGYVVEKGEIESLKKNIVRICETRPYSADACRKRAKMFSADDKCREYVKLYKRILEAE